MKYKMSNKLKVEKIIWIGILKRFSSSDFRSSVVDQPGLLLKANHIGGCGYVGSDGKGGFSSGLQLASPP